MNNNIFRGECRINKRNMNDKQAIINNIQQDIKKDLEKNGLGEFSNLTNTFFKLMSEAVLKEREKTEYWKTKAYILFMNSNIGRLECPEHDTHIERSFDIWQVINDKKCRTCEAREKGKIKEAINKQHNIK